ncbi:MAG: electron transfer flavoprotein subunit beta [Anaerolineales bacterium]|nr:electron transfer flavoprotein subunit beta [Anaerolineales bacterium]
MLKIAVCVKAVPDPKEADKIRIDPKTKALTRVDIPLVLNPNDKYALEAALQLKEDEGAFVTVLSMGPPPAAKIVRECMALGADEGILLTDTGFSGADAYATARTLATAIRKLGQVDLVLCGMASSDGSTEWVGPELATLLELPVVTRIREVEDRGVDWWTVRANIENGYRRLRIRLPAVLTVTRDLNVPRALSFSGVVKAGKMEIVNWDAQDLGLITDSVGLKGSPSFVSEMFTQESKREVRLLEGTREEKAQQLLQVLADVGVI